MNSINEKFLKIEQQISEEKGDFRLFALVYREGSENIFDVLLSAKWIDPKSKRIMDYLVGKIVTELSSQEIINISRVILLDKNDPFVKAITNMMHISHSISIFQGCTINNIIVDNAVIISACTDENEKL